ncbi:hypothetical protein Bbelb_168770 [Branchiostoma belcheri]|nr:hypothetical protein Bbelb_168770 [Branchiostoma belcheri]
MSNVDNNVETSNAHNGQNDPVVEMKIKVFVNNGEVQVTSDVTVNKTKPANPALARRTNRNVPRVTTPPVVDLTVEEPPHQLIRNIVRETVSLVGPHVALDQSCPSGGRVWTFILAAFSLYNNGRTTSTDPFEETPTVVDLTLQEEEDVGVGSEEDDPKEDDVQEEDIVPEEDILVRDVTEEEWEESGFDRG